MADGAVPSNLQHSALAFSADTPIPLEGDLTKWRGPDAVTFAGKPMASHPHRATVYTLWDQETFYLAFDVHSSKLQTSVHEYDGDKLWEDDGVEFLIDAMLQRTKEFLPDDFSYHINILNAVYDDRALRLGSPILTGTVLHNTQYE